MELASMFITVLVSSIMAGLVTYKVNDSKETKCFLAKKAEELYCYAEAVDRELSRFFGERYSIVGPEPRNAEFGEDALRTAGAKLVSAKMLVGFYFPALSSALARTIAAATTAHASLKVWENAEGSERDPLLIGLDRDIVALKDSLESFKTGIIESGRTANNRAVFVAFRRPATPMAEGRILRVAA
jgi:hypothetical protein